MFRETVATALMSCSLIACGGCRQVGNSHNVTISKAEYEQLKADAALGRQAKELRDRHAQYPSLFDECGNPLPPAAQPKGTC
jgi:hypothetical protein